MEDKLENNRLKYIEYTFERHGIDADSREGQLIYYAYGHGYHQAEKDMELCWEDMFSIFRLVNKVLDDYADGKTKKEVGEEVLRRFKDYKERK